ncbi:ABC transporter substrate-binding protein (plasmid) [Coraliomargarita sp. W4R53]
MVLISEKTRQASPRGATRRIRRASAVVTAALVVTALAGCSTSSSTEGGASSDPATIWAVGNTSATILTPSLEEWNVDNPDATIEATDMPGDEYKTKIRTAIAAGAPPSLIFSWGGDNLKTYAESDIIVDLTEPMAESSQKFLPSILAQTMVDDRMYSVPISGVSPVVLYVNEQVLSDAGVDVPETWDDLLDAVGKLKDAGVIPISLAGAQKWTNMMWMEYLVDRIGGPEVFQAVLDEEPDAWSNPAVLEASNKIIELLDAGAFGTSFASVTAPTGADAALVYTGKAGMLLQGAWVYGTFRDQAPDFAEDGLGYASFPTIEGGVGDPSNVVGVPSTYLSVSADASEAEQASGIEYLADGVFNDSYTQRMVDSGLVPPISGIEDQLAANGQPFTEYSYDLAANAGSFQASWDQELASAQATPLLSNLDLLFAGELTAQEFSDAMNATIGDR